MNERIKKLAEQAQKVAYYTDGGYTPIMTLDQEKFAELIIRHCAKSLWTEECHTSDLALEEFERNSAKIKEHFGVEDQVNDSKELHTCPYREELHNDYESLCDCDEEQQHQCAMDI